LDAKPVSSTWGSQDFDDKAQSAWGFSLTDVYIDSNHVVGTVNSKGYKQYCYMQIPTPWRSTCDGLTMTTNGYALYGWYINGTIFNSFWLYAYSGCRAEYYPYGTKTSSCGLTGSNVWYK
jgi:hypothetical protein